MARSVFMLVSVGAVVIAAGLGLAWHGMFGEQVAADRTKQPTATPSPPAVAAAPSAAPLPAAPAVPDPPLASPPAPVGTPSFDIARIGPDGRAVIAGQAAPGAKIVLLDGGKEIAHSQADSRGEWVVLAQEPPLSAGQHELRVIQHIEGKAPVTSEQVVVAVVPAPPSGASTASREETLVMIKPRAGGTTLLQPPSAAGVPKSQDLAVSTVDYDERGQVTISGQAQPDTVVRAYLNDHLVGEIRAGADGRWKLAPPDPVGLGHHRLRLDRIAKDGKPVARLELPFDRVAPPPGAGNMRRLHIVRGDNLWNIAHAHYGHGLRFTVIYGANKDQIRDPHKIYPGQVLSLPQVN